MRLYDVRVRDHQNDVVWAWSGAPRELELWPHDDIVLAAELDSEPGALILCSGQAPSLQLPLTSDVLRRLTLGGTVEIYASAPVSSDAKAFIRRFASDRRLAIEAEHAYERARIKLTLDAKLAELADANQELQRQRDLVSVTDLAWAKRNKGVEHELVMERSDNGTLREQLLRARRQLLDKDIETAGLKDEVWRLSQEVQMYLHSNSWRITKPIREIRKNFIAPVRSILNRQEKEAIPEAAAPLRAQGRGEPEILFVSHEASLTGAPILLLRLLALVRKKLSVRCSVILRSGGGLENEFRRVADDVFLLEHGQVSDALLRTLSLRNIKLIYSSTVTNGEVQERLRALDVPILCHVHELGFSIENYFGAENFAKVLANTDFFLAGSEAVAKYLVGKRGLDPSKVEVAYPFLDAAANQDARGETAPLDLASEAIVVGACGTATWRKGTDLFVQVARRTFERTHQPVIFVWLGGSEDVLQTHRHDAAMLGIADRVLFVPSVAAYLPYLARFDVFLLPSREDPYPLVVLDAASFGIPTVCFADAGGIPEFIEQDAGRITPYLDVDKMADAVIALAENEDERERLGQRAKQKVCERHSSEAGGNKLLGIFQPYLKAERRSQ